MAGAGAERVEEVQGFLDGARAWLIPMPSAFGRHVVEPVHNSNHMVAGWLRERGFEVRGNPALGHWRTAGRTQRGRSFAETWTLMATAAVREEKWTRVADDHSHSSRLERWGPDAADATGTPARAGVPLPMPRTPSRLGLFLSLVVRYQHVKAVVAAIGSLYVDRIQPAVLVGTQPRSLQLQLEREGATVE